jgi:hypothetical protein
VRWLMWCGRKQRNVARKPAIKFVGMADALRGGIRDNLEVTVQKEKRSTSRSDLRKWT